MAVTNESGYATCLYRMEGPVDQAVGELHRAMAALNFRRNVLSASERELESERMTRSPGRSDSIASRPRPKG